jgi:hypothetical protein
MGAKFTLVLDTDDPQGLRDALEIAHLLNKNHNNISYGSNSIEIGKISLIKLVRQVAKDVEEGKITSSLRDSKHFVDDRWVTLRRR